MLALSFFGNSFTVFKKKLTLKIDSAAPGGGQRNLTYFEVRYPVALSYNYYANKESTQAVLSVYIRKKLTYIKYFPWPQLEARLSMEIPCSLFKCVRKMSLIYTLLR